MASHRARIDLSDHIGESASRLQSESTDQVIGSTSPDDISALPYSKPAAAIYLVLSLVILTFLVAVLSFSGMSPWYWLVAGPFLALMAAGVLGFWHMATTERPALLVNSTGIRITYLGETELPWSQVVRLRTKNPDWMVISFEVDEPGRFIDPPSNTLEFLLRFLGLLRNPPLSIPTVYVKGRADDILALIERYRAQASASSEPSSSRR